MNLLIDVGNSRIKYAYQEQEKIYTIQAIAHQSSDYLSQIKQHWQSFNPPQILAISSVSKATILHQLIDLGKQLWPTVNIVIAKSSAQKFSLVNAYPEPEKLGVDRWLALLALNHYYPGYCCVVDCGTAITIDCLNSSGIHQGGLITPGLELMKQSLYQGTENITDCQQNQVIKLANNTASAIYTGTLYAAAGFIEKAVNDFQDHSNIVLTGGDAAMIADKLTLQWVLDSALVLKGLALYCSEHPAQ